METAVTPQEKGLLLVAAVKCFPPNTNTKLSAGQRERERQGDSQCVLKCRQKSKLSLLSNRNLGNKATTFQATDGNAEEQCFWVLKCS